MQLNIHIPDEMWERLDEIPKEELVRLIRIGKPQKVNIKKKNLMHYFGSAKGAYTSAKQADAFIRSERNAWQELIR